MYMICEGPHCEQRLTQPKTGRRRRFCSAACRKAAYDVRHNTIAWEPLDPGLVEQASEPIPAPRPDDAVAVAIIEARTLAGAFTRLGRLARPQLAWRCEKTGAAINAALDDYFDKVER